MVPFDVDGVDAANQEVPGEGEPGDDTGAEPDRHGGGVVQVPVVERVVVQHDVGAVDAEAALEPGGVGAVGGDDVRGEPAHFREAVPNGQLPGALGLEAGGQVADFDAGGGVLVTGDALVVQAARGGADGGIGDGERPVIDLVHIVGDHAVDEGVLHRDVVGFDHEGAGDVDAVEDGAVLGDLVSRAFKVRGEVGEGGAGGDARAVRGGVGGQWRTCLRS
jgi:hypothetical protein